MIDRDDLIRHMRDAYEGGDETARDSFKRLCFEAGELLGEAERFAQLYEEQKATEARLRDLLLRASRCLATAEPQNRHPVYVLAHQAAVELQPIIQAELR